ncbi:hypothetical protein Tco_0722569 [Tanacetum coccineum]
MFNIVVSHLYYDSGGGGNYEYGRAVWSDLDDISWVNAVSDREHVYGAGDSGGYLGETAEQEYGLGGEGTFRLLVRLIGARFMGPDLNASDLQLLILRERKDAIYDA